MKLKKNLNDTKLHERWKREKDEKDEKMKKMKKMKKKAPFNALMGI